MLIPKTTKTKGKPRLPFWVFIIGCVFILAAVFGAGWVIGRQINDAKNMSMRQLLPTITMLPDQLTATTTPEQLLAPTATAAPTLVPQCGVEQAVWNILLIAKDYEEGNKEGAQENDYSSGFADAIRLVQVDFRDSNIHMIAIPRDLMVSIPGLQKQGIYQERLKMAYAYGYEYDYPGLGPGLVVDTLQSNFGFHIDQTITLNFLAFYQLVETLGGLDVIVYEDAGEFTAGEYHMDGYQALEFARLRDKAGEDTSDISRMQRQTQVIFAIRDKVLSSAVIPHAPQLITEFIDLVSTDLNMIKMNQLLCLSKNIKSIESIEMDEKYFTIQIDALGYERYLPNYEAIRSLAEEFQIP